jgi:glutamate synthase domain-containing protein 2/glutamate synthase domain-containing protein 1/glutamate synthase domain-containing protein 3
MPLGFFTRTECSKLANRTISRSGLYDPRFEHDACGIGFTCHIDGHRTHEIVRQGFQILVNLTHRGACGCDPETGDGCGMMIHLPHELFAEEAEAHGFDLPAPGEYGVGMVFLPQERSSRDSCMQILNRSIAEAGQELLGWREVPRNSQSIGWLARENEPFIMQVFIKRSPDITDVDEFERKLYVIRKNASHMVGNSVDPGKGGYYVPSMSARTIVYKGLMLPEAMDQYYLDLADPRTTSGMALVHQRYSTNTLPAWSLAQPFRFLAHNGEINTLRGNLNMMDGREHLFESELFGEDIDLITPILSPGASDSANFDNAFECLVRGGRSVDLAMAMMIPEPWSGHETMSDEKKAFYEFHACKMEPWDGPASMCFSDGIRVGAVLDRNGLRPSRYWVTDDGQIIMASEAGVLDIPQEKVVKKGRLEPGRMFLVDMEEGRMIPDAELKDSFAKRRPYREWLNTHRRNLPEKLAEISVAEEAPLVERQMVFGYSREDIDILLAPMAEGGKEAIGSMGNDAALAVLSPRPQLLYNYFKQLFAQVTNPPIDSIREEIVMSLETDIGREGNLLGEDPLDCRRLHLKSPILTNAQLQWIKEQTGEGFEHAVISCLFHAKDGPKALDAAITRICREAEQAVDAGKTMIILSDRGVNAANCPVPALLAVGAVHQYLVHRHKRPLAGIISESGEPREVMHFCLLTGYGADAVNPYGAYEAIADMLSRELIVEKEPGYAQKNFLKAINTGLLKVMSKIGISTQHSYRCAQIFEAVGLNTSLIERAFSGTPSRVEGIGIKEVAIESLMRHAHAYPEQAVDKPQLEIGGAYRWRRRGEFHQWNPETVAKLQYATKSNKWDAYEDFAREVNDRNRTLATLRGLLKFKTGTPIPLEEVESASEIVRRFCTGAMSYGSISGEAHENLAIAMNRIGGRSNTGEGGEDPLRFQRDENGDLAQGAKPGEGGQLPGHKVFDNIAKVRYSTPGVELISPPPHHDIYSIEDLAQLIHDLKNANVHASVSVKLVSEVGVGTIAAGVSKGKADLVLISGHDGGTGASPLTSIKYAGLPWELGLAETHQVLVENDLRDRIRVQVDGQFKTGRDVVIGALLGADEVGFATAPLIVSGCIMMRKCHLNTCPVGIATQDPELRRKFEGKPEHVVNYFFFVAEEARRIMAELGFRTYAEMIGRADMLAFDPLPQHWKARHLDFSRILYCAKPWETSTRHHSRKQDHGIDKALDHTLMDKARMTLTSKVPVRFEQKIRNVNRTVGTMLSSELTRRHNLGMYTGSLPDDAVWIDCEGTGGQSFGAFAIKGLTLNLTGESNDYVGKGLSGGRIIVKPPASCPIVPEENMIVGNVVLYGATSGEAYFRGLAGERFAVRNSGAWAVVEGVGDHGCEYMTGGRVAVLGATGRNFAAGMSGGVAYVYDPKGAFPIHCNKDMVDLKPLHAKSIGELKGMLERHVKYTGSTVAARILENWEGELQHFVRVMPRDYARVLKTQEEQARLAVEEATSHVAR